MGSKVKGERKSECSSLSLQVYRGSPLSMHGRSSLDAVAMAYAREVYVRNEAQLQGLSHSLITAFHQASASFPDKVHVHREVIHLNTGLSPDHEG